MSKTILTLDAIDKFYGKIDTGVHAVRNFSMTVEKGEIVALLGSSGCGKTSTLRMIAGFEETSRGRILLADREIQNLAPVHRNVAMAFEGYSLYPTVNVRDNIAFALKARKTSRSDVERKVAEIAEMLDITDILDRFPTSISGGQQQRVSLARALIRDADLHLLDEPMGQLEPQLRSVLRGRIKHFIKERGLTTIIVTHDQTEANALADRIAVMEDGEMQQYATPDEIKETPANFFTGTFIGEPPMNVFDAAVTCKGAGVHFDLGGGVRLSYKAAEFGKGVFDRIAKREKVIIGVRPYSVRRGKSGIKAKVLANQWLGDQTHIAAEFAGSTLILVEHERAKLVMGDSIHVALKSGDLHIFDSDTGKAISHGNKTA